MKEALRETGKAMEGGGRQQGRDLEEGCSQHPGLQRSVRDLLGNSSNGEIAKKIITSQREKMTKEDDRGLFFCF